MSSNPYIDLAQSLQGNFAKAGVTLNLRIADVSQVLSRYRQWQQDMIVFVKALDYNDPDSIADFFTRNAAWRNHWVIPELARRTTEATGEQDPH